MGFAALTCTASQAPLVGAQTTARPSAPPGWTVFTRTEFSDNALGLSKPSSAFRIAIPPGWVETSLEHASVAAGDRALASANPAYAQAVEQSQAGRSAQPPLAFSAMDPDAPAVAGIVTTTLYVTGQHAERPIAASTLARSMQRYREQTMGAVLWYTGHDVIDGNDTTVLHMKYDLRDSAGKRTTVTSMQYIIVRDRDIFIIEFTGALDQMDQLITVFDSIARTFKIL